MLPLKRVYYIGLRSVIAGPVPVLRSAYPVSLYLLNNPFMFVGHLPLEGAPLLFG